MKINKKERKLAEKVYLRLVLKNGNQATTNPEFLVRELPKLALDMSKSFHKGLKGQLIGITRCKKCGQQIPEGGQFCSDFCRKVYENYDN